MLPGRGIKAIWGDAVFLLLWRVRSEEQKPGWTVVTWTHFIQQQDCAGAAAPPGKEREGAGTERMQSLPWCRSHRDEAEMTRRTSTRRAGPHPHGPPQRVCLAGALEETLSTDTLCAESGGRPWEKSDLGSRVLARWFQNHTGKTALEQKFPCW